ncbi:amidohydrolase [Microbacterium resistens]|uniref:Peptidase M20 domain-containing protein 2 n=1 Tax=Microbacterium resistens TaxID=156977 RepID=A0ABU1S7S7_9MICO|nr:M20 family metallopeptidase [Microbacterium resistens]MDR6865663.1 amidohydrolase [Microbacterium resistens]
MENTRAWLQSIRDEIEPSMTELDAELVGVAAHLHAHPETRFEEVEASRLLTERLREHGFEVKRGFAGLDTAFVGRWESSPGTDAPTIAIFCEYDALEGIGHGCGHNIIAACGLGAAIIAKTWLSQHPETPGRLVVVGSPGEEGGAGKVPMIEAGVLDGVDAAMMIHPLFCDLVDMRSLGRSALDISFDGRASHASGSPHDGINALDAATLTLTAIGLLRQQMRSDARVHGIISDGGQAPNIIPEHTALRVFVRTPGSQEDLRSLTERVSNCARGAALATGCTVRIDEETPAYLPMRQNRALGEVAWHAFETIGRTPIEPYAGMGAGSTDMGNVSLRVPSIHPVIRLGDGLNMHTREFSEAAGGPEAAGTVRDGARILGLTAIRAFADPALLTQAREEFQRTPATRS